MSRCCQKSNAVTVDDAHQLMIEASEGESWVEHRIVKTDLELNPADAPRGGSSLIVPVPVPPGSEVVVVWKLPPAEAEAGATWKTKNGEVVFTIVEGPDEGNWFIVDENFKALDHRDYRDLEDIMYPMDKEELEIFLGQQCTQLHYNVIDHSE